jgi:chemotaxis protein methyltransferase CheR
MGDFFFDTTQLEYLVQSALPELVKSYGYGVRRRLVLWCMQCSNGEEPYTLAMVLKEFSARYPGLEFDFLILATDAAPGILRTAERAIYLEESVSSVPMTLRKKYLLRSKDRERGLVKIAPELKESVKFRNIDFMTEDLKFREPIDIIFCRDFFSNVDRVLRASLLRQFCRHLSPGGYLFLDRSESLTELSVSLTPAASGIYRKLGNNRV